MIDFLIAMLIFLIILSSIIFIHELGHFIFAKRAGIYCHEFAIGMGPKIWSTKKGETVYSIRWIPLGGYVSMAGEGMSDDSEVPKERMFQEASWKNRFLTVVAGPLFNFIFAFVLIVIIGFATKAHPNVVSEVTPNSPAEQAGIVAGTEITEIEGSNVRTWDEVTYRISLNNALAPEESIDIEFVTPDGTTHNEEITPAEITDSEGNTYMGIGIMGETETGIIEILKYDVNKLLFEFEKMILTFQLLFSDMVGIDDLAGPVGIYEATKAQISAGVIQLLYWTAFLSINIGFMNLIPFPALDGGRLIFMFIEKLIGRPVSPKIENAFHMVGLFLLLALFVYVTYNDIIRLFN